MTETPNLHLTKDATNEYYSVERVNANSDKIDTFAGSVNTALAGKQSTLTWDEAPTQGSTNAVNSGAVYTANAALQQAINALSGGVHLKGAVDYYSDLPASPSEGDAYTVRYQGTSGTDPLGIEYAWATYQGTPQWIPIGVDPSVFAKQAEMNVVANAGAKNILNVSVSDAKSNAGNAGFTWTGNTASKNHVNFKINSDLTVDVSSDTGYNASDTTIFYLTDGACAYPNTILNGCPSGGSNTTYELRTATPVKSDYGSGVEIKSDTSTNVVIIIRSGWSGELTFKPMIRPAAITDSTFQPFARTNRELTVLTDEDRAALIELVDGGDKNKLQFDGIGTKSGNADNIDFTYNSDGSITVNGTVDDTGNAYVYLQLRGTSINAHGTPDFCTGDFVLSGCQSNESGLSLRTTGTGYTTSSDTGKGVVINPVSSDVTVRIAVFVARNSVVTNLTVRPMICTKAAWKISQAYQPYRPSWQEMWDEIQALQSGGNRALTMQMQPTESTESEEREGR